MAYGVDFLECPSRGPFRTAWRQASCEPWLGRVDFGSARAGLSPVQNLSSTWQEHR